jgi:hypothetical protein
MYSTQPVRQRNAEQQRYICNDLPKNATHNAAYSMMGWDGQHGLRCAPQPAQQYAGEERQVLRLLAAGKSPRSQSTPTVA